MENINVITEEEEKAKKIQKNTYLYSYLELFCSYSLPIAALQQQFARRQEMKR